MTPLTATLAPALEAKIMDRIQLIPVFDALKIDIQSFSEGECVAKVPRNPAYDGILNSFHGGMLMTVADTIACFAVLTLTDPEEDMATTDMNIRFLSPCFTDVTARARVIKLGRSLCPVQVDLFDDNGKHVAIAQVTYMRLPKKAD